MLYVYTMKESNKHVSNSMSKARESSADCCVIGKNNAKLHDRRAMLGNVSFLPFRLTINQPHLSLAFYFCAGVV